MKAPESNTIFINPLPSEWPSIIIRPLLKTEFLKDVVEEILQDVNINGDKAVKKYSERFDKIIIDDYKVSKQEMVHAIKSVDEKLTTAIRQAKFNIEQFHKAQIEQVKKIETAKGILCWRKSVAIENIGLYIPGGTAPLFSTLLMLAVPAMLAGCKNIVVCTPCDKNMEVHPAILYTASLFGINNIFKIGGAQAIGAMAYGTEIVPRVNKIFGPGNQFVTCAKQIISQQGIAIDMPAGPSELAIYADHSCNPIFVAADLLSQSEHGADSQVMLVAPAIGIIEKVQQQLSIQLKILPRKDIAEQALNNSRYILLEDVAKAFEFINSYAPEHLIIASASADKLAEHVINAGSVFLGNYSPESAGDYASGTNHILPTNGYAKSYSGVSVDSFVKKITFQQLSKKGLINIAETVQVMAEAEGLQGHKNAVTVRLKNIADEH